MRVRGRYLVIAWTAVFLAAAGTIVFPYITLVHRRGDIWEDPLEFRPERFLDTPINAFAWIPFGGGRRRCLGAAFSLVETRMVLRTILRNTNLTPNPRRPERISRSNVFLVPGRGGSVRLDRSTMAFGAATSGASPRSPSCKPR